MLFNTLAFLLFFAVVLLLYWLMPVRMRTPGLLVASYFFYAYWDWRFLGLIIFVTFANFHLTRLMGEESGRRRRQILIAVVSLNLVVLGTFKYLNFFANSFDSLVRAFGFTPSFTTIHIILPLGISFFTFKAISYAVDVYRQELEPTTSLVEFGIFLSYFPYMIAGPIMSAKVMLPQLRVRATRLTSSTINSALLLIALGFFRKTVIGDYAAPLVSRIFGNNTLFDWKTLLIGIFAFSLQIYGDFAGYSDMARGISRLLGIELIRNFQEPYLSKNITEFWRHWHISLSSWFRKYLYIPLGGNRVKFQRSLLNLLVVMTVAGLWHGAAVTFLIWGLIHGLLLVIHKLMVRFNPLRTPARLLLLVRPVKAGVTFIVVSLIWVFFRADSFHTATEMITRIAGKAGGTFDRIDFLQLLILILISFSLDFVVRHYRSARYVLNTYSSGLVIGALFAIALSFRASEIVPFVYFQF
ncbi:MAG: MBOAT family O-acyltransferase [Candidatus Nanopelagicaceae bacterium]|nr:MBOAT family O-acyltransferase [Candidatus Nanopelagicaceae bacterium]